MVEVATPDDKQIALVDAWIWNNAGYRRFNLEKPAELASPAAFAKYLGDRSPEAVYVLLTHDHGDHMGDFFELLSTLVAAGLPVKATGQADMMRKGLVPDFERAGLNREQVVVNGGGGQNFGGVAQHGAMRSWLVPALHSTFLGYPAAGFIFDVGGVRFYASGDTDLFGDMKLIGERYRPDVALVCSGAGPFTMGPRDAALTCQWLGVSQAVPIHFAHNLLGLGPEAGDQFREAIAELAPGVSVHVLKPGESTTIHL